MTLFKVEWHPSGRHQRSRQCERERIRHDSDKGSRLIEQLLIALSCPLLCAARVHLRLVVSLLETRASGWTRKRRVAWAVVFNIARPPAAKVGTGDHAHALGVENRGLFTSI